MARGRLLVSRLAAARVRPRTQRTYEAALLRLLDWLCLAQLPLQWSAETWDSSLEAYLETLSTCAGS